MNFDLKRGKTRRPILCNGVSLSFCGYSKIIQMSSVQTLPGGESKAPLLISLCNNSSAIRTSRNEGRSSGSIRQACNTQKVFKNVFQVTKFLASYLFHNVVDTLWTAFRSFHAVAFLNMFYHIGQRYSWVGNSTEGVNFP